MENDDNVNDNSMCGFKYDIEFFNNGRYFSQSFNRFTHVCICTLRAFYLFFTIPYIIIKPCLGDNSILNSLLLIPFGLLFYVPDILLFVPGLPAFIWWIGLVTIIIHAICIVCWTAHFVGPNNIPLETMYAYKYEGNAYFSLHQVKEEYRIKRTRHWKKELKPKLGFLFPVKDAPGDIQQMDG